MWRTLLVYNLLLPVALVYLLPLAWIKMRRRGGGWRDLAQRQTLWPQTQQQALAALPSGGLRYWVHAVSVGEVNVARKLISALLRQQPEASVVLTTTTPTGYELALQAEAEGKAEGNDGNINNNKSISTLM